MKKLSLILLAFAFSFTSCGSDDDSDVIDDLIEDTSEEIEAVTGEEDEEEGEEMDVNIDEMEMEVEAEIEAEVEINTEIDTENEELINGEVFNLHADATTVGSDPVTFQPISGGDFTKFDFETGEVTDSETDWDIAFRTTTIAINGGVAVTDIIDDPVRNGSVEAAIASGTFDTVITADDLEFNQDAETGYAITTGSDNGWYNYNTTTNIVTPIPGKVLVFKTRNGNYAKVEISSYYLNEDESSDSRYYTFYYTYNTTVGDTSFE